MQVELPKLQAAISIACRLGFAKRLPNHNEGELLHSLCFLCYTAGCASAMLGQQDCLYAVLNRLASCFALHPFPRPDCDSCCDLPHSTPALFGSMTPATIAARTHLMTVWPAWRDVMLTHHSGLHIRAP